MPSDDSWDDGPTDAGSPMPEDPHNAGTPPSAGVGARIGRLGLLQRLRALPGRLKAGVRSRSGQGGLPGATPPAPAAAPPKPIDSARFPAVPGQPGPPRRPTPVPTAPSPRATIPPIPTGGGRETDPANTSLHHRPPGGAARGLQGARLVALHATGATTRPDRTAAWR